MTPVLSGLTYDVIDLSRMSKEELAAQPRPLSSWPRAKIKISDVQKQTCIASWKRDISSVDEISNRLSECAWDGITMGFRYMLADIISLRQDDPEIIQKLIEFSRLYEALHAVISYDVDPDLKRPWLRSEARAILKSPTQLPYIELKWRLKIPLLLSLTVNQVCTRRLGLFGIDTSRLFMCDGVSAAHMRMSDLGLFRKGPDSSDFSVINLDRRRQLYASDMLLVCEINRADQRPALIAKLRILRSNSVLVPALTAIWAMMEGLSLSLRGCDWDPEEVLGWTERLMRAGVYQMSGAVDLQVTAGSIFNLTGGIEGALCPEVQTLTGPLALVQKTPDLLVRSGGAKAKTRNPDVGREFLEHCLDAAFSAVRDRSISEPAALLKNAPQYELIFDDREHHDPTVPDGPAGATRADSPLAHHVSDDELRIFQNELSTAIGSHGNGMEVDISVLCQVVAAHRWASHRFAVLLCSYKADRLARLELAEMISEAWQAEFKDRQLRDLIVAVEEKIMRGSDPTLQDIEEMML